MKNENDFNELRKKALKKLPSEMPAVEQMSKGEIAAALQELKVHQIELEMQNQELRSTQDQLQKSREEYTALFDFAPIGYVAINKDHVIKKGNLTAARLLGIPRSKIIGRPFAEYIRVEDRDKWFLHARKLIVHGQKEAIELQMLGADQTFLDVYLKGEPVSDADGNVTGARIAFVDITPLKESQRRLKTAHDELARKSQELDARNVSLTKRTAQLSKLTSAMTDTEQRERKRLARILHDDLQQLMAAAKFNISAILSKSDDPLLLAFATDAQQMLDEAIQTSRTLTTELSPTILHESGLIDTLNWLCRWVRDKHKLSVTLEAARDADTNSDAIKLLVFESVRELLFNVVKHAGVSEARVRLSRTDGRIQVVVTDMGAGFDPSSLESEDDTAEAKFGLFSLKERVLLFDGELKIDSVPGRGSTFTLTVPLFLESMPLEEHVADEPGKAAIPEPGQAQPGKIRLMLVEDHAVVRQGLAAILRRDAEIEIAGLAADGQEAVEMARQIRPDVILMDYNLPKLSGVEATRAIHAENPGIRIIGLSMYNEMEFADNMKQAGAAGFLSKAGPGADLISGIKAAVLNKVN